MNSKKMHNQSELNNSEANHYEFETLFLPYDGV